MSTPTAPNVQHHLVLGPDSTRIRLRDNADTHALRSRLREATGHVEIDAYAEDVGDFHHVIDMRDLPWWEIESFSID